MQKQPLAGLLEGLDSIGKVYRAAAYGARHREAMLVKMLAGLGCGNARKRLTNRELIEAVQEVRAIEKVIDDRTGWKPKSIRVTFKELSFLRRILRDELRTTKRIPTLSREQSVVSLAAILESFIGNVIKGIFDSNIDSLKSGKSTLKDEELIDAIKTGDPLDKLKEARLRDLMFGSVGSWAKHLQRNLGFQQGIPNDIIEMFLVRNCLVHNNKLVSRDLEKSIRKMRYAVGKHINVTEKDYNRYATVVRNLAGAIWKDYADRCQ